MNWLEQKHLALLDGAGRRQQPDLDKVRLCFELLALGAAIDRDCATRLGRHRLSEGKFVLLFLLLDAGDGLSPHQLAERAGVTRATITGLLDGLERDGFVVRAADPLDRRRVTVRLTAAGRETVAMLADEHSRWIATLFADVTAAEQQQLSRLLQRIWLRTDAGHDGQPPPATPFSPT